MSLKSVLILWSLVILAEVHGQSFYVMSFNIRYDNPSDGPDRWDARKAELADLLFRMHPEVIGLQEAMHHQLAYLDSALTDYTYLGVGREDGKTGGEYAAILYDSTQLAVETQRTFWLSEQPDRVSIGWDAALERICTVGRFRHQASGRSFIVFNTHFDHVGRQARSESARVIAREIDASDLPVILLGDLNATPEEEPMRVLKGTLQDAYDISEGERIGPDGTWNGFALQSPIERRIDYVMVRDFQVLSHVHVEMRRANNRHFSDHLPVICQLSFR